jgi:hypothetical protein
MVALAELKVSFWISNEENSSWMYINTTVGRNYPADPYYDTDLTVSRSQAADATGTAGADTRFDFTFSGSKALGSLGANETLVWGWYMELDGGGYGAPNSNPENDYSYRLGGDPGASGGGFDKVALYVGGVLVWGCEP